MDPYRVLGVSKHASHHEIKRAYRRLALKYHPDRNPNNEELAKKQFQMISEAYDHLTHPKRKMGVSRHEPDNSENEVKEESEVHYEFKQEQPAFHVSSQTRSVYEAKDVFLGMLIILVGHIIFDSNPSGRFFVGIAIIMTLSLVMRAVVNFSIDYFRPYESIRLGGILISNVLVAIFIGVYLRQLEGWFPGHIIYPIVPSLILGSTVCLFAASTGRAFSAVLGNLIGFLVGSLSGGLVVILLSFWLIVLFGYNESDQSLSKQASQAIIGGVALASGLGSLVSLRIFLYDLLDIFEFLFDHLRVKSEISELAIRS